MELEPELVGVLLRVVVPLDNNLRVIVLIIFLVFLLLVVFWVFTALVVCLEFVFDSGRFLITSEDLLLVELLTLLFCFVD